MEEEKKSFILYADLIHTIEKLPNEDAGELFKHILRYVNGRNPTTENILVDVTFEPIKQQLKRDFKSWESSKEEKSIAGIKGNLKRWHVDLYKKFVRGEITLEKAQSIAEGRKASQPDKVQSQGVAKIAVNDNVNVNVNVNDNVNVNVNDIKKEKVFNFRLSLIELGVEEKVAEDWMKVRKTKKATNTETSFNRIKSQIEKSGKTANECISLAVAKDWKGFEAEWVNNTIIKQSQRPSKTEHIHVKEKKTVKDWFDADNL